MKLEEYLEKLEACPDDQLTDELGVYDNWPILINADYDAVLKLIEPLFEIYEKKTLDQYGDGRYKRSRFNYRPGTVILQVNNYLPADFGPGTRIGKACHSEDYNMMLMLHDYQDKKIPGISNVRAIANAVIDLSIILMKENISACFPDSRGWKYQDDFSRIAYFP